MFSRITPAALLLASSALAQNYSVPNQNASVTYEGHSNTILRVDNGTYGPVIEEVHYYYKQWPIGIAVASDGRIFASYTRGDYNYTLGVCINKTAEVPYPPANINLPASELNTTINGIPFGSSNSTGLINVQAVYITSNSSSRPETLWVLDTGRPTVHSATGAASMPYAQPGGPKLIAISLTNNTVYRTYTFPVDVYYPDSYFNDLRFDFNPNLTDTSGGGIAYLVDSSNEGRPGFIMLDLASGKSWRRLTEDPSVLRVPNTVPSYFGKPFHYHSPGSPISWPKEGLDGIQVSPDGSTMYYSPLTSTHLYSIPTANLREQGELCEIHARANVSNHGERGGEANGFEGDSLGHIYQLMPEQNAIYYYDPQDGLTKPFVQDPRMLWPDGASVGADGYIYMNINQLPFQADWNNGTDLRTFPGAVLRAKLPNGASKITSLYQY